MFTLSTDTMFLRWNDGELDGWPLEMLVDSQSALNTTETAYGTPTGPFYERGTPEHAYIVLKKLWPDAEVGGEPPVFEPLPDELG